MRLAGTVNYPDSKKVERGYRTEVVTLRLIESLIHYRQRLSHHSLEIGLRIEVAARDGGTDLEPVDQLGPVPFGILRPRHEYERAERGRRRDDI